MVSVNSQAQYGESQLRSDEEMERWHFKVNPDLSLRPFDGGNCKGDMLCELAGSRWVLPPEVATLLRYCDGNLALAEVLEAANRRSDTESHQGRVTSLDAYRSLVRTFLYPKGILITADAEKPLLAVPQGHHSYFRVKIELLSGEQVCRMVAKLSWLCRLPVCLPLFFLVIAAHISFYGRVVPRNHLSIGSASALDIFYALLIAAIVAFCHELGHATSLVHIGGRRPSIGWGVYITFMVLYTDLSEAWAFNRGKRMLTDIGGIYFQGLALTALMGVFVLTHSPCLLYAIIMSDIDLASTLNPFFRMDGYWFVADALGIPDLRQASSSLLRNVFMRSRQLPRSLRDWKNLRLNDKMRVLSLMLYSVSAVVFFIVMSKLIIEQFLFSILPSFPGLLFGLWSRITHLSDPFGALNITLGLLWRVMASTGLIVFASGLIVKSMQFVKTMATKH